MIALLNNFDQPKVISEPQWVLKLREINYATEQ
jgi:hypothetical protein